MRLDKFLKISRIIFVASLFTILETLSPTRDCFSVNNLKKVFLISELFIVIKALFKSAKRPLINV